MTASTGSSGPGTPRVEDVRFEHHRAALGVGEPRPRLSWRVATTEPSWRQRAYEVALLDDAGGIRAQSGRIDGDESALVGWPFAPLAARERVDVQVRVWSAGDAPSAWSAPATVEAGLLAADDWSARFVMPAGEEATDRSQPSPYLRREFEVRGPVARARLYVTALGVYEAEINGAVVGDEVLAPGWTSYNHRLRYQTFDVAALLRPGRNAIGAVLGDGWFRGPLGWMRDKRNVYGDRLALLAQLEITYTDGTSERVVTDEQWRSATGPILASDIYDGESYDARLELAGWSTAGFDAASWAAVAPLERDLGRLVAPSGPPVRRIEEVRPAAITRSPRGRTIVDFGQNLVGRLRLTVSGAAGDTVRLRHAEVLEHGELSTRPLRSAKATDHYTLRGGGPETWEPRFTFHGFRYAEVEGWPGELRADDVVAVVCHSDLERTGWFECSDPEVNRLHDNVVWSMRGNFLDIPTDCPQRDERLGWTGDIQVFAPAATFLYDAAGFLQSWLRDLAAEQAELGGVVPHVVPNILDNPPPAAAWGDAAVIVPWVLYQRYGDAAILESQFGSMRGWVDAVARAAGPSRLWDTGFQYGDWLDPDAPPEHADQAKTSKDLVATAYFARSAELVAQAAEVLGRAAEVAQYHGLAAEVRSAFQGRYVVEHSRMTSDAATAYALALEFGLLADEEARSAAGRRLAELVADSGYHISTGFVGTPLICDALCHSGSVGAAYQLLMQRECPSWLYAVTMGATTIWERWDSLLPDGSVNPGSMTSFNHYALGAVADWIHRTVAGLAPAAPGYRRIAIAPQPGGGLSYAHARHRTPYGVAECGWRSADGTLTVDIVVPPNTTATVTLPGQPGAPLEVGAGTHQWRYAWAPQS